ncbi:MAG: hypothetical protein M1457_07195 [bacterium]|nr:hypothetical protein [bacterium]
MAEQMRQSVAALATGKINTLAHYTPRVEVIAVDPRGEANAFNRRHTPMLKADTPWNPGDILHIEVPEYVWATVPGDPSRDPLFFGRAPAVLKGSKVRFPSLEPPVWKPREGGGLALDNPLAGDYVQRFRVIPRDRVLEIWVGVTNNSARPLENLRTQLCLMPDRTECLKERWPTSSRIYSGGEVVSWDSAGQSLSWLDEFYNPQRKTFSQSCFFISPLKGYEPPGWPEKERARKDLMLLARPVDVAAIAKQDPAQPRRNLIVYSPFGQDAFYNCLVPCFHADPHMKSVAPGETRWTVSFYIYYEGDLAAFFEKLTALDRELHRDQGLPVAP